MYTFRNPFGNRINTILVGGKKKPTTTERRFQFLFTPFQFVVAELQTIMVHHSCCFVLILKGILSLLMSIPDCAEDLRQLLVDGFAIVVERRRLQNDGSRSDQHGQSKYPQEEPIQHHGYVLPILADLKDRTTTVLFSSGQTRRKKSINKQEKKRQREKTQQLDDITHKKCAIRTRSATHTSHKQSLFFPPHLQLINSSWVHPNIFFVWKNKQTRICAKNRGEKRNNQPLNSVK